MGGETRWVEGVGRKKGLSRHLLQEGDISYPELEWGRGVLWRMGGSVVGLEGWRG